jgi:hypothetical protein
MARLPANEPLRDRHGQLLTSIHAINAMPVAEKERIYGKLLPARLYTLCGISPETFAGHGGQRLVTFIAPEGLGLVRIKVRQRAGDTDLVFFLELADTPFGQMELSFCIINDPAAPRFNVDRDSAGNDNCFTTLGRNIHEEIKAMAAGLFPNQTRSGLRLFGEFFPLFERFVDALGIEMIVAEPLTYDNAIRYEKYGFDYLTGRRLMQAINLGFSPDGELIRRLDDSTPFRRPGMEKTVRGRSWAIHDGILDEPWDGVHIYKMIGVAAGIDTFPERLPEEDVPSLLNN